jgi:hypothetical protein
MAAVRSPLFFLISIVAIARNRLPVALRAALYIAPRDVQLSLNHTAIMAGMLLGYFCIGR